MLFSIFMPFEADKPFATLPVVTPNLSYGALEQLSKTEKRHGGAAAGIAHSEASRTAVRSAGQR